METSGYGEGVQAKNTRPFLERMGWLEKTPLVITFGAILGLSAAGSGIYWLAWIGLIPLVVLTFGCSSAMEAMVTGFVFGLSYHLVALRWLLSGTGSLPTGVLGCGPSAGAWLFASATAALLVAVVCLSVFVLPMRAGYLPHYRRPFFPALFSIPIIWVFLHWTIAPLLGISGVLLDHLAYSQASVMPIVQLARYGGAVSLEFIIVLVNCVIAFLLIELTGWARNVSARADFFSARLGALLDAGVVIVVAVLVYNCGWTRVQADAAMPPHIMLWAMPGDYKAGSSIEYAPVVPVAVLPQPNVAPLADGLGAALIVLPAVRHDVDTTVQKVMQLAANQKVEVLMGTGGPGSGNNNIGVCFVSPSGIVRSLTLVDNAAPALVKAAWGTIGVSVSDTFLFPNLIAGGVSKGAALIVDIVEKNPVRGSILSQQFIAAAVFRAVENGRYFILCGAGGPVAVIDPSGIISIVATSANQGVLLDRVQFLNKKTLFNKMWWMWTPIIK